MAHHTGDRSPHAYSFHFGDNVVYDVSVAAKKQQLAITN